jgi:hypothetical protein
MAGGAGAAAAIAQAIKASGAIVRLEPDDFSRLVNHQDDLLVIRAQGGVFGGKFQYLTSYKGLIFYAKSREPLYISNKAEVVEARKIWIPA